LRRKEERKEKGRETGKSLRRNVEENNLAELEGRRKFF
jgi:hypothetical protein